MKENWGIKEVIQCFVQKAADKAAKGKLEEAEKMAAEAAKAVEQEREAEEKKQRESESDSSDYSTSSDEREKQEEELKKKAQKLFNELNPETQDACRSIIDFIQTKKGPFKRKWNSMFIRYKGRGFFLEIQTVAKYPSIKQMACWGEEIKNAVDSLITTHLDLHALRNMVKTSVKKDGSNSHEQAMGGNQH